MIVLDTHIWYWWINADRGRVSSAQIEALRTTARVGVSAVSCFEMAHAVRRGRIELPVPMREWFAKALGGSRIELFPLTPAIASRAVDLTDRHRDPFDRIIIATALELDGQLASADGQFAAYPELAGRLLA
ncbi:MAG: type II toxin-antitoxin system VapC family toxin [Rubrivivax sp.]|nr:type II toxin-antitoxin system VapC family toxin [Rubrivivax sp.]